MLSHSGIKIPFFTFFAHDSGKRPKEAPFHMLLAMGITAFLCIFIGVYPDPLYAILPYEVEYHPYTMGHVVGQLQLLCFALLAFGVLYRTGIHPPEIRAVNLDTDWTYRKAGAGGAALSACGVAGQWHLSDRADQRLGAGCVPQVPALHRPGREAGADLAHGAMVIWIAILLGVTMMVNFLS